jgi:hypothetical protein
VLGLWCLRFFRCQRDIPEAIDVIALSDDNYLSIRVDFDVVFCEQGDAVIITQLADGDKSSAAAAVSSSSVVVSTCLVVVVIYLGLEVGDGWHKRLLHLLHHTLLLGCICHFLLDFLLDLLFGAQAFEDLVDDGGGVSLAMEAEGICGNGRLTLFDVALSFLEVGFECWPGYSASGLLFYFLMSLEKW